MRRILLLLLVAFTANADVVLDQEQLLIEPAHGGRAIGGASEQKLAQTVTAGISGRLVEVHVPVACGSGEVILEIFAVTASGAPRSPVYAREHRPAGELPRMTDPPAFHRFVLDAAPRFEAGDRFTISLRNKTGECRMWLSPKGDTYPAADGWFVNNTPPTIDWTRNADTPEPFEDWPFRTFVDNTPPPAPRSSPPCIVTGFGPIGFIPSWLPVCRCLQDQGLREFRCAFFHPDFFLFRRTPWPLKPEEKYNVKWTLVPLVQLKGVLEVSEGLGFKGPLTFFVDQLPPGESMTLEYPAVAGKAGDYKVESTIVFTKAGQQPETGRIRTVLEVAPKP
jgi:hypothetical protein